MSRAKKNHSKKPQAARTEKAPLAELKAMYKVFDEGMALLEVIKLSLLQEDPRQHAFELALDNFYECDDAVFCVIETLEGRK